MCTHNWIRNGSTVIQSGVIVWEHEKCSVCGAQRKRVGSSTNMKWAERSAAELAVFAKRQEK